MKVTINFTYELEIRTPDNRIGKYEVQAENEHKAQEKVADLTGVTLEELKPRLVSIRRTRPR